MTTAVLASGTGTLLEALLAHPLVDVALVVADRDCRALDVARDTGIEAVRRGRTFGPGFDRAAYTEALTELLERHGVDLVAMAGFGTVLSPSFFDHFGGRVLNTHPSLLPAFRGWHAVADALAAGVATTGCTVHLATESLDDGPVLAQATVAVLEGDDVESLHERIKVVERELYPAAVAAVRAALDRGEPATSVAAALAAR